MTRFGEISQLGQTFKCLRRTFEGLLSIWQNFEPTWGKNYELLANLSFCKQLNNEKYSNHLVALAFVILVEFASTNLHQMRQMCGGSKVVCQNVAIVCMRCQ